MNKYKKIIIKTNIKSILIYINNYKTFMLVYFNYIVNYIYSYFENKDQPKRFEKPRGYKNISSHEILSSKR